MLTDIRVVELCQNVAGPYAGLILAGLGARVIKVERPGVGDDARGWGPPFQNGESVMFSVMNAGKESHAIDIDTEAGLASLRELIEDADVFIASLRPSSLERRGLDYPSLSFSLPGLVYCSLSGFGNVGPLGGAPGYDPLIQAFSGLMSITGHKDSPPIRVGTSVIDIAAGMWAAIGILVALRKRDATGEGSAIQCSLLETGLAFLPYQIVGYLVTGELPQPMGSALPMVVPYQAFQAADRPLVIAAGNDNLWVKLCEALSRPDLRDDPSLATNPQRVLERDRVVRELASTLSADEASVWKHRLDAAGVPCSLIHTIAEVVEHPQTRALEMLTSVPHEGASDRLLGLPFRIDGARPVPPGPAPGLPTCKE